MLPYLCAMAVSCGTGASIPAKNTPKKSRRVSDLRNTTNVELIAPGEINYKSVKANIERLKK